MQKIPTLYVRDTQNPKIVTAVVTPGCEWVIEGQGVATRKWDGTNVRVMVYGGNPSVVEKRRNPSREQKALGEEPGYIQAFRDDPNDKHIFAAVDATDFTHWPDGFWSCEALGPKIQGGADGLPPSLVGFSLPTFAPDFQVLRCPRSYFALRDFLEHFHGEGIVWHHPDGRMAKIKRRDFRWPWPLT